MTDYAASTQNKGCGLWARQALVEFQRITGSDTEDAMSDMLADLMHLSAQRPEEAEDHEHYEDFDSAMDRARRHFEAERKGDD